MPLISRHISARTHQYPAPCTPCTHNVGTRTRRNQRHCAALPVRIVLEQRKGIDFAARHHTLCQYWTSHSTIHYVTAEPMSVPDIEQCCVRRQVAKMFVLSA
eukprot:1716184-Rhodomonas_salina.2